MRTYSDASVEAIQSLSRRVLRMEGELSTRKAELEAKPSMIRAICSGVGRSLADAAYIIFKTYLFHRPSQAFGRFRRHESMWQSVDY